ncbi:MAG: D-aminoacyl-tRNA deacylase [Alphaproteobacteria bacterium]|nr:D-aminoacyl-tRNA deacylase [Alphaproteobacteria bacterium]
MRALLQRVKQARVEVNEETIGAIGPGLVIFVCAMQGDSIEEARYLAGKAARMRLFADEDGKTNLSVLDTGGEALVVSQFTLAAEWKKGNRPGFSKAAPPDQGKELYEQFCTALGKEGVPVQTGQFAANMQVSLVNYGPFTIWMDSAD